MTIDLEKLFLSQASEMSNLTGGVRDLLHALKLDWERQIWTASSSGSFVADALILARPIIVRSIVVYNGNPNNSVYIQAHNKASKASDGEIGLLPPMPLGAENVDAFDLPQEGTLFSTGLYICGSQTNLRKQIITTNDLFIFALYRPAV